VAGAPRVVAGAPRVMTGVGQCAIHTQVLLHCPPQSDAAAAAGEVPTYAELKQLKKELPRGSWLHSLSPAAILEYSQPRKLPDGRYVALHLPRKRVVVCVYVCVWCAEHQTVA
jgi:hypothetical protein